MSTVHQIRESVRVCRGCDLYKTGHGPVPFSGPAPSYLAVIGATPDVEDDELGQPFAGKAGLFLRDCMTGAGLDPTQTTFINMVSCLRDGKLAASEIAACTTNLQAQLAFTNPVWAILLGSALASQRPDLKITRTRGKVLVPDRHRWKFFVTFDPHTALGNGRAADFLRRDLGRLGEMMDAVDYTSGGVAVPGWMAFSDSSCVRCGAAPDELGEHDQWLRFDGWGVPYCNACWVESPEIVAAAKDRQRAAKTGQLFL